MPFPQVLNAYGKVYPTPPPSRRPIRVRQARQAAEKAAKEGDQPGVDGKGHEADGTTPDDHGRHKLGQPATPATLALRFSAALRGLCSCSCRLMQCRCSAGSLSNVVTQLQVWAYLARSALNLGVMLTELHT